MIQLDKVLLLSRRRRHKCVNDFIQWVIYQRMYLGCEDDPDHDQRTNGGCYNILALR